MVEIFLANFYLPDKDLVGLIQIKVVFSIFDNIFVRITQ